MRPVKRFFRQLPANAPSPPDQLGKDLLVLWAHLEMELIAELVKDRDAATRERVFRAHWEAFAQRVSDYLNWRAEEVSDEVGGAQIEPMLFARRGSHLRSAQRRVARKGRGPEPGGDPGRSLSGIGPPVLSFLRPQVGKQDAAHASCPRSLGPRSWEGRAERT